MASGPVPVWLQPLTATLVHAASSTSSSTWSSSPFAGGPVENVLGPAGLAILYVLGAYAAAGAQYLVDPATVPMIGASGAISRCSAPMRCCSAATR